MTSTQKLAELSRLAGDATPNAETMQRALSLLADSLDAEDVLAVYANGGGFQCAGASQDAGLSDAMLSLINRDLIGRQTVCTFDLEDGTVRDFRDATTRSACHYMAALIPSAGNAVEMLLVRGSWPKGAGDSRVETLQAALPAVALLMERRLNLQRVDRQRSQLNALANIARVISQEEDLETVLTSIAGSIAMVANMDYVTIDLVDSSGHVQGRAMGSLRAGDERLHEYYKGLAHESMPVRDAVLITRSPMLFADAQEDHRIPESARQLFEQTLIQSAAMFPLLAKDEVLGTLGVATYRKVEFLPKAVESMEALAAQVAATIKGIYLYRELTDSQEELRRVNQQLQESMGIEHHLARTDALTGIPNRRFIDETIAMELSRANRYGQDLSIVMADLDDLKEINDSYGHEAGDGILRFVGEMARQSCRQVDVVGRYGGDEFVFVLPSTSPEEAALFSERFRQQLAAKPASIPDVEPLRLTVSLGVAYWDRDSLPDPAALIRLADRAMYKAKAGGRNRTVVAGTDAAHAA